MKNHYFSGCLCLLFIQSFATAQVDSLAHYHVQADDHRAAGDYAVAVELYARAIQSGQANVESDSLTSVIYHKQGLCYYFMEHYQQAITSWKQSIHLKQSYLPKDHIEIIKSQINVASGYMELLSVAPARAALTEALRLVLDRPEQEEYHLSRIYQKLGVVENMAGNPSIAIDYLLQSFGIRESLFSDEPSRLVEISIEIFDVYKTLNNFDKMLEWCNRALSFLERTSERGESYLSDKANILNNKGIALTSLGRLSEAEVVVLSSLHINQALDFRAQFIAINYSNLIQIYNESGKFEVAFSYIDKAKHLFFSDRLYQQYLPELYLIEGDVYFNMLNMEKASVSYHAALSELTLHRELGPIGMNPGVTDLMLSNERILFEALFKKATSLYELAKESHRAEDLNLAYHTCRSLYDFIEQKRYLYSDIELHQFISAQAKSYYSLGIEILYHKYLTDPSADVLDEFIYINNQSKAALLFDALSLNARKSQNIELKHLLQRQEKLLSHRADHEIELLTGERALMNSDTSLQAAIKSELYLIRDSIRTVLMSRHESDAAHVSGLQSIQNRVIATDELILQYFVGVEEAYLFVISTAGMSIHQLGPWSELENKIRSYVRVVGNSDSSLDEYVELAYELYTRLVAQHLVIDSSIQRLRIIPDDLLSLVPFEALISHRDVQSEFKALPYLLNQYIISYASSISVLQLQNQRNNEDSAHGFIGFASDFSSSSSDALPRMSDVISVMEAAQSLMGGSLRLNEEATKANFIKDAGGHQIIHMSLHGTANVDQPSLSYLQFDPQDSLVKENRLYANQIYTMDVPADLLLLSACETGVGQLAKGEGVMSISHAFGYAGASAVGMSLWSIPVYSTSLIELAFYRSLKNGAAKSAALRDAKLDYVESQKAPELAHPFYWASIIIYGNQSPIEIGGSYSVLLIGSLIFLGGMLYLIFSKRVLASSE